jgi:hypothetical protein
VGASLFISGRSLGRRLPILELIHAECRSGEREREREREREGDRETTSTSPVMSMIQKYMGAGEASARGSVGGTRTFAGMKGGGTGGGGDGSYKDGVGLFSSAGY